MKPLAAGLALVAALAAVPAHAQSLQGAAAAFNAQRRVFFDDAVHEQTGVLIGGHGAARLGPLLLDVSGVMGTLAAAESGVTSPDVKVRTTALRVRYAATPAFALGVHAEARRFEADAGVTMWRLIGATAHVEPGLGRPGLRALADVSLLPASSVVNGPKLKMAMQAMVGLVFEPPRSPLSVRLGYRFERFDIDKTENSPERYEQFRGLVVEAGLRLGR